MSVSYKGKIWIDLDNSPHVPFFKPIIEELKKNGYLIVLTARECSQVCGLADLLGLKYQKIGRHFGKNKGLKALGLVFRSFQLLPLAFRGKFDLALSHGSRAQILTASILRIPSIMLLDYEFTKGVVNPTWLIMPELVPDDAIMHDNKYICKYPGIKEDVYAPNFKPNPKIKDELGINGKDNVDDIVVTIRPPATKAHYHKRQSEELFMATIEFLGKKDNTRIVVLPRYDDQKISFKKLWPGLFSNGKIIIPERVIDGLSLMWYSDVIISGGGTMNREAAALGVPVYSIFRGKIGAVDRYLSEKGRLTLLEDTADIPNKIKLVKMDRELKVNKSNGTLNVVVNHILKALET